MICEVLGEYYDQVGITYINNERDLAKLIDNKPDLAFLGFKNMPSLYSGSQITQDIWICERLDDEGISYTGSAKSAMLLDHNKDAAKEVIQAAGLLTAPYFTARPNQYSNASDLPLSFPLFIKPPQEGGGTGIDDESIVRDFNSFQRKVKIIERDFGTPALVEKYLVGREFSVALLETGLNSNILTMPIELISEPNKNGDQILSRKVKSEDTEHVIGVKPGQLRDSICRLAIDAFRALGARDYGRIDIRMDEAGNLNFLEANLIPGVAMHNFTSYFTSACQINQAMDYDSMILNIIELGLARNSDNKENIPSVMTPTSTRQSIVL